MFYNLQDPLTIKFDLEHIADFHYLYLETMYYLNELYCERHEARLSGQNIEDKLQPRQDELVARAKSINNLTLGLRAFIYRMYNSNPEIKKTQDEKCKNDIIYWINLFGWSFDPRLAPLGLLAEIPMVLWPEQINLVKKIEQCYKTGTGLIIEKSRAWGVTDLACFFAIHHFLFTTGFECGFGSQKAEKVDSKDDPDAIFPRLRRILYSLPREMKPEEFRNRKNDKDTEMKLVHPTNQSIIKGDAGDNIGRGGRSSIYFVDEKAAIEHPELVDASLSQNARCQVDISTPQGMNAFYKKRQSGKVEVFSCWWYADPAKNPMWRESKRPVESAWKKLQDYTFDETIVAQEIDINYLASVEGIFIKPEWVEAAVGFDIPPGQESIAGFDVASGGKNSSSYIHRQGPVVDRIKRFPFEMVVQALWKAVDAGAEDNITTFNYDHAGIGESVESNLLAADRQIPFHFNGIYGQTAAPSDFLPEFGRNGNEIFRNLRGYLYYQLAQRFKRTYEHVKGIQYHPSNKLISIPDDMQLKNQLSSVKKVFTSSGKIGAQSKDDMRKDGIPSPDDADALCYCFADAGGETVADAFDYTKAMHFKKCDLDFSTSAPGDGYVSMHQTEDLSTSIICCYWCATGSPRLIVAEEYQLSNPDPTSLISSIKESMHADVYPIKRWICNPEMMPKDNSPAQTPWYLYRKSGVTLQPNYIYDSRGSLMTLNRMFEANAITIDRKCVNIMAQLSSWRVRKGEPDKNLGLAQCLVTMVGALKKRDPVNFQKFEKQYGKMIPVDKQ